MSERDGFDASFRAHLPVIDRAVACVRRRQGLSPDEASRFGAWVRRRIAQDDHALLARFRGGSSLATYLTVLVTVLYREYRVDPWHRAR